jgi:hypothetical protein
VAQYEYRVLHMPTTSVSVMNERLNNDARDGWEPVMMSGNEFINVLIRRPVEAEERQD